MTSKTFHSFEKSLHRFISSSVIGLVLAGNLHALLQKKIKIKLKLFLDLNTNEINLFSDHLERLEYFGYSTEKHEPVRSCNGNPCNCDPHYMIATYKNKNHCVNTFYLPNGDVNNYPSCDAPCCATVCG